MDPIVIVGSGLAGYSLLKEIRKIDSSVPVTIVTADDGSFYSKPNLSAALSQGKSPEALATASAASKAAELNATILPNTRALSIDPAGRVLRTSAGALLYRSLALALGADPVPAGLEGSAASEALSVNDLASYAAFRKAIEGKRRVAILGGGLIGCEFANDLAASGFEPTVVHPGEWPLERLLPRQAGESLAASLSALGARWLFGRKAVALERSPDGLALALSDGSEILADAVLSAIGLRPRVALASEAGLLVGRGVQTDAFLRTSEADIYALGDCAEVDGLNLPYIQPLMIQAKALASTLCGAPAAVSYPPMPVAVKTPAFPVSALPPAPGILGEWSVECSDSGVCALRVDASGKTVGFALAGSETRRRSELLKAMAER